jgi:dinuclear metal center YbgI/SA1388 family protein
MASLTEIVTFLDTKLRTSEIPDAEPALNGLQLGNDGNVSRVAVAVDFSLPVVRRAAASKADLLIVHHGMLWRGRERIVGAAYDRLKGAIDGNVAVYSSHIPLDVHPRLGNNALLARELQLETDGGFGRYKGIEIGVTGAVDVATGTIIERMREFSGQYGTHVVSTNADAARRTKRFAIITGSGADTGTIEEARERGVDTLIVGEGPHHSAVQAMEQGLVVVYGGHYATETLGVRALGALIGERFRVPWEFLAVPTGL